MDTIKLVEYQEFKNQFIAKAMQKGQRVGHAIYHVFEQTLYLTWIETGEQFQGQGVGRAILDFLATKALDLNLNLAVIVIDEYTLKDFYLKWFSHRVNAGADNMLRVEEHFEAMIKHSDTPSLLLTPSDLMLTSID